METKIIWHRVAYVWLILGEVFFNLACFTVWGCA